MTEPLNSPPAKKSKLWLWIVIGVVIAVCVGGLVLKGAGSDGGGAKATSTATKQADTVVNGIPEPIHASSKAPGVTKIVVPATLTGYPKITNKEQQQQIDTAVADFKSKGSTEALGGAYGNPDKGQLRMFLVARVVNPDMMINLTSMQAEQKRYYSIRDDAFKPANAGPLGGQAVCGYGQEEGVDVVLCIWADPAVTGVVYFFNTTDLTAAQKLFVTARGQIETKS